MATRATLRGQVRDRLADTGVSPLWSDLAINSALSDAAGAIGPRFPLQAVTAPALLAAATSTPVPTGALTIQRVFAPDGSQVDRADDPGPGRPSPYEQLTWRIVGANIVFSRALNASEAGSWSIEHSAPRTMPADDVTTIAWPNSLLPALVAWTAGTVLRIRLVDDAKRGNKTLPNHARLVEELHREADRIVNAHRRRAVGGVLS